MPDKTTTPTGGENENSEEKLTNNARPQEVTTTTVNEDEMNMEELEEMFNAEIQRRRSKKSTSIDRELRRSKSHDDLRVEEGGEEIRLTDLDPIEFRLRLNKLQDLGFEYFESLRALALTGGDVIEAAFMLSSEKKDPVSATGPEATTSDHLISSDDAQSQCTFSTERSTSYQQLPGGAATSANSTTTNQSVISAGGRPSSSGRKGSSKNRSSSNSILASLAVIEVRILAGSIRIIDDCNQLDIPLLELGIRECRLLQQNASPVIEAYAQTNFYCDYYNSHLSGWEPVVEHCQVN